MMDNGAIKQNLTEYMWLIWGWIGVYRPFPNKISIDKLLFVCIHGLKKRYNILALQMQKKKGLWNEIVTHIFKLSKQTTKLHRFSNRLWTRWLLNFQPTRATQNDDTLVNSGHLLTWCLFVTGYPHHHHSGFGALTNSPTARHFWCGASSHCVSRGWLVPHLII